jgi:hypothetical protein
MDDKVDQKPHMVREMSVFAKSRLEFDMRPETERGLTLSPDQYLDEVAQTSLAMMDAMRICR